MIDTVFGIKVRMSGLCINRYRPIIGRLADNRPLPYQCISIHEYRQQQKLVSLKVLCVCVCVCVRDRTFVHWQSDRTKTTFRDEMRWMSTDTYVGTWPNNNWWTRRSTL